MLRADITGNNPAVGLTITGFLDGVVTSEQFERAGIQPTSRAEELDVFAWGRHTCVVEGDRSSAATVP